VNAQVMVVTDAVGKGLAQVRVGSFGHRVRF
jgi:hypothetical protein